MLTGSSAEFSEYLDEDGLIGSKPHPEKWSTGNALLETSLACFLETKINERQADIAFLRGRESAISRCRNPDGSFDKNPDRPDQITHDDLMAIAATQRICGFKFAYQIVEFGIKKDWMLSNTSFPYWDAYAKPWQRAFYMMACSSSPAWYESLSLSASILFDAYKGDSSSNRINLLVCESVKGIVPHVDAAIALWRRSMKKKYGDVGGLMLHYYGTPGHPFVKYGSALLF